MLFKGQCWKVIYGDDEKEGTQDRFLGNAVFEVSQPALLIVTGDEGKQTQQRKS